MKKFWKRTEGFTLVELIVVIAILGILAGVGTVGYSGYIKKANMAADISLASEVEQALMLAHYSGQLNEGATVVIHYGEGSQFDVECSGESTKAAMIAAFGANYEETLRLKWSGWREELGVAANGEIISYVNQSAFAASDPDNVAALLDNVQYLTDELSAVTGSGAITINPSSDLGQYLIGNGIDLNDSVAASNATTLFVADKISNATDLSSDEALDTFKVAWASMDINNFTNLYGSNDQYASTAAHYAQVLALATYVDGQSGTSYVSQLNGDSGVGGTAIKGNITTVLNSIAANNMTEAQTYMTSDQATSDAMAFLAYMNGITSSSDTLLSNTDLSNDRYYNDGTLLNYVTDYMSAANALADINAEDGAFVFYYNTNTGSVSCVPLDY